MAVKSHSNLNSGGTLGISRIRPDLRQRRRSAGCSSCQLSLRPARLAAWRATIGYSVLILLFSAPALASPLPREEPTVEGLKAKISAASVREKPHLCIEVAKMQLAEANKLYADSDLDKAQAALTDVVAYSELARDYAIQSHKYQKQSEIAVRVMTQKLTGILHSLGSQDQAAVKDAVNRLQRVSDDLLSSMFKTKVK